MPFQNRRPMPLHRSRTSKRLSSAVDSPSRRASSIVAVFFVRSASTASLSGLRPGISILTEARAPSASRTDGRTSVCPEARSRISASSEN